jgi:hypothetical protein
MGQNIVPEDANNNPRSEQAFDTVSWLMPMGEPQLQQTSGGFASVF